MQILDRAAVVAIPCAASVLVFRMPGKLRVTSS